MRNKYQNDPMLWLIDTGNKALDATLRYMLQKEKMRNRYLSDADINRVADVVMSQIDVQLEEKALRKLMDMMNELGRFGK